MKITLPYTVRTPLSRPFLDRFIPLLLAQGWTCFEGFEKVQGHRGHQIKPQPDRGLYPGCAILEGFALPPPLQGRNEAGAQALLHICKWLKGGG
jgi:hypothetical protein